MGTQGHSTARYSRPLVPYLMLLRVWMHNEGMWARPRHSILIFTIFLKIYSRIRIYLSSVLLNLIYCISLYVKMLLLLCPFLLILIVSWATIMSSYFYLDKINLRKLELSIALHAMKNQELNFMQYQQ